MLFGLFTFWCPVKKNGFLYSLVLNISAWICQFGPCFQTICFLWLWWYQHRQGTIKTWAKKTWRFLDYKTKTFTTTIVQCWTEFPKSLTFLHFLCICFSESHMHKEYQKHNVTMSNTLRKLFNFISPLKTKIIFY